MTAVQTPGLARLWGPDCARWPMRVRAEASRSVRPARHRDRASLEVSPIPCPPQRSCRRCASTIDPAILLLTVRSSHLTQLHTCPCAQRHPRIPPRQLHPRHCTAFSTTRHTATHVPALHYHYHSANEHPRQPATSNLHNQRTCWPAWISHATRTTPHS